MIIAFGNDAQKQKFLPRILSGEDWWCQGYSEPGAGSDLASLKTRAVREGDFYIVNGQKTWTTLAQYADWIFCLVRTDTKVKSQEGISFLADRHEVARHHRQADHHPGWLAGSERSVLRQCEGAAGEPHRRGEQGLDLCQVPAQP